MAKARVLSKKTKSQRRKKQSRFPRINLKKTLYTLLLFFFLVFSVGMLTYVVFFRMVVAAELSTFDGGAIVFEEPDGPNMATERSTAEAKKAQQRSVTSSICFLHCAGLRGEPWVSAIPTRRRWLPCGTVSMLNKVR